MLGLVLILAAAAAAQDWPQLLGPTRNGVYAGPFSPDASAARVWKRSAGGGFSAPVVAGDRVLLFHREGDRDMLESLDSATGKTQWTFAYKSEYKDNFGFSEGPRATPTADGDRVYLYSAEGLLHCVSLNNGAKLWGIDARKDFGIRKEFFGAAVSPVVDGDRLLMNIGGQSNAGIVALDKLNGNVLWKTLATEAGYASPVVAEFGGRRHALFFTRDGLVDVDPKSSTVRFQHPWRARMAASINGATPLVQGSQVFISSSYNTGAALLDIDGDKPKVVWSGDDSMSNHYSTSVYKDGNLYGFHGRQEEGQSLRCVDWKTGRVRWNSDGLKAGTVTLAGAHLLVVTEGGELIVAPASPDGFKVAKRAKLLSPRVRAYPALSKGRIYVRSETEIAAFKID